MTPIERPAIAPLRPAFRQTYHSTEELDRLKQATLDILETVGVQFQSDKALGLLADHGVRVDRATQVAHFPPDLVLDGHVAGAAPLQPRRPRRELCDRGRGRQHVLHHRRLRRRDHRLRDARAAPVHQGRRGRRDAHPGLPLGIAFWWPTLSAGDYGETAQLHELDAGWNNTVKHLQGMVQGERQARYAVEMATRHRRRRRGAAPPAGHERSHRHDLAARPGQRRHRGGSGVRRGRRAGVLRHDADPGHDGAGHQGRRLRDGGGRAGQRDRPAASSRTRARRCCTRSCRARSTPAAAAS